MGTPSQRQPSSTAWESLPPASYENDREAMVSPSDTCRIHEHRSADGVPPAVPGSLCEADPPAAEAPGTGTPALSRISLQSKSLNSSTQMKSRSVSFQERDVLGLPTRKGTPESLLGLDPEDIRSPSPRDGGRFGGRILEVEDRAQDRTPGHPEDIDILIHRASIKGEGLPDSDKRQALAYESSIVSNITDLGAQGLRKADQSGSIRVNQTLSSASDEEICIQDRLLSVLEDVPGHTRKGFFPRGALDDLITAQCVKAELVTNFGDSIEPREIEEYTMKICGTTPVGNSEIPAPLFKKIFVTLVLSEKIKAIPLFIEEGITDADLPLRKVPTERHKIFSLGRLNDKSGLDEKGLPCFREWAPLDVRKFEEWQWTTLAPFFHPPQHKFVAHFILQDEIPLPFKEDSRYSEENSLQSRLEFEGGYSNVFKVKIHPDHHAFHARPSHMDGQECAIKCLLSKDRLEFQQEAGTLMKFSGYAHPHLISLLATYEQFNRFYLVFPWAQADLRGYWSKIMPNPTFQYENILWVATQCRGIAHGLLKIHQYESTISRKTGQLFGRHGDIKPENVLWFCDSVDTGTGSIGTLKITDFGLTEFSKHSKTYRPRSKLAVSPSYRPPECDLEGSPIGRSSDIWSLGCLYLEMIAWTLGGWNLVQKFNNLRLAPDPFWYDMHVDSDTFFEIVRGDASNTIAAMVKPAVSNFILDLHAHPRCSDYLHDFISIVQIDMLVVKRPQKPNHGRIPCTEVYNKLRDLHEKREKDQTFATEPRPWPNPPKFLKNNSEAFEAVPSDHVAQILEEVLPKLRRHEGRHISLSESPGESTYHAVSSSKTSMNDLESTAQTLIQGTRALVHERKNHDWKMIRAQRYTTPF